jgi:LEA14-like dessication related protein
VTIIDGAIRQKVMSSYQTPKQIAEQANITLQDEDKVTMAASTNMVADGAGVQLTISRATPFTLVLYGTKTTVYTQEKTVGDMLKGKNIVLGGNDTLNVPLTARMQAGAVIELWRNGKQTATEEQDIAFETEKVKDADQPVGYHNVTTAGETGKRTVTYEVEMKNGVQVNRVEIQSVVTKEPKKQVEVVGMKYTLPSGSHEDWMAASGIAPSDYGFVNYIVGHEGGWCPVRWQGDSGCVDHGEAPKSGGYGLVQATPGGKMASAGSDWLTSPITQLRWATSYAVGKYGSWEGAYNHWTVVHSW